MHTACLWSEKLPFAGYSVVKDHSGGNIAPRNLLVVAGAFPPDPLGSLARGAPTPRSARSPNLSSRSTCCLATFEAAGCSRAGALGAPGEPRGLNGLA